MHLSLSLSKSLWCSG